VQVVRHDDVFVDDEAGEMQRQGIPAFRRNRAHLAQVHRAIDDPSE